jgi:hypothetical protein
MVQIYQSIDFRSDYQPLAQWFKSALFVLSLNESQTDFTLPTDIITDWIQRFDEWFKGECGVHELCNLHLLYHREIGVLSPDVLKIVPKLQQLGTMCRKIGFGFSVTVGVTDAIQYFDEFKTLVATGNLSTIGLRVYGDPRPDPTLLIDLAQLALEQGVKIGLIGPIDYFQSSNLLSLPQVNAGGVTLYPVSHMLPEILPTPDRATTPCSNRFRLHIDSQGWVYPCFGLLGIESACLGSVGDDFTNIVLGGQPTSLDLKTWAQKGVTLDEPPPPERISTMPWICERHRLSFLNQYDARN